MGVFTCTLLAFISLVKCTEKHQGLMAFEMCYSDKMSGLTWIEVEKCEEKFPDLLDELNTPSKEDFKEADLNGDGTLMYKEWEDWVKQQTNEDPAEIINEAAEDYDGDDDDVEDDDDV